MAISANTVFEVRTTGSDTQCSGGFVAGASGTDYSQQDAAQFSGTDLAVDATTNTKVTSASHNFVAADVGNLIQITAGTGWTTGFYQIVSVASNAATLDRSPGATGITGGTWWEGGALASGGKAAGACVTGNLIYVKNGTYTITTATTNVSGGTWLFNDFSKNVAFIGYGTTRTTTNTDTKPLIQYQAGLSSATFTQANVLMVNLALDGTSQTSAKASGNTATFWRCSFTGFTAASGGPNFIECSATANSAAVFAGSCVGCEAYSNTATPFSSSSSSFVRCLSYNNTGASTDGFFNGAWAINCIAYGNGRHGFNTINALINCHAENNGGLGFSTNNRNTPLLNCSGYNNTSGLVTTSSVSIQGGLITVTDGSVFTSAAGNDFSLNATALRGALLRAAGLPATFPRGTTLSYADIGAAQHADPASGGLLNPLVPGLALVGA